LGTDWAPWVNEAREEERVDPIERETWRVDVSRAVEREGATELAIDVVLPCSLRAPAALLFCLPGGFLSRRYFDPGDPNDEEERSYSLADYMARRGYAVAMVDHLGCGDSWQPSGDEGYGFGVDAITRANHQAWREVHERLCKRYDDSLVSVGLGHSMGSALTVALQANHRPHAALVLQSFSTTGLPGFLQGEEAGFANDPERTHAHLARLVRERFGTPYPGGRDEQAEGGSAAFSVGTAPPLAAALLQRSATNLIGMAGLLTMIPGGYAPYAEKIDVPVFVAYGDHDLGRANNAPPTLPHAPEVLAYTLHDSWHCHNVANSRRELWERTGSWLESVIG